MAAPARSEIYVVAAPGLERLTAGELAALGYARTRVSEGGVAFDGTLFDAFRANLHLRTATRVLWRLASFDAVGERELLAGARKVDLASFHDPALGLGVHVSCEKSRLFHTGLVTDRVLEALGSHPPAEGQHAPTLHVRLVKDRCTLSIDTSGELLHKRGFRQETSRAPLRETLAAGMLLAANYTGGPFVDPMCGSGTIVLEAAFLAANRPPCLDRAFDIEGFPAFEREAGTKERELARSRVRAVTVPIVGSDLHGGALGAARRNADRAGIASFVQLERADAATRPPPAPKGHLVTNPPYGQRVLDAREPLTACLANHAAYTRAVLVPRATKASDLGLDATRTLELRNGGIPVTLHVVEAS